MNWSEFFHMGGYAFYVWTSYAIALVLVILNIVAPVLQRRRIVSRIKRALRREALERDRERDRQSSGQ
jgi:heme exporter protein D